MKNINKNCIISSILLLLFVLVLSNKFQQDFIGLFLILIIIIVSSYVLIRNDNLILICIIASALTVTFLVENIRIGGYIRYVLDYFIIIAMCKNIYYFSKGKAQFKKIYSLILIFTIFTMISAIVNKTNIIRYTYMFYIDYFRYFIVFISIINFRLKSNFIEVYIKKLYVVLLIQIPIVIIQYFYYQKNWVKNGVGDIMQDYISGIMGGRGSSEIGMLICIALAFMYILYQRKKVKILNFVLTTLGMIFILVVGEIKFCLMFLVVIILLLTILRTNFKGIVMVCLIIFMSYVGMNELGKLYGWEDILTKEALAENFDFSYAGTNLSRSSSFKTANEQIEETGANKLLGRGIGNVKVKGTVIGRRTEFQSNNIYEFRQFTISQYLAENGWLGFITLTLIYVYFMFMSIILMRKGNKEKEQIVGNCGIALIIVVIVSTFYSMCMTKVSFSILAWVLMGMLARVYFEYEDNMGRKENELSEK